MHLMMPVQWSVPKTTADRWVNNASMCVLSRVNMKKEKLIYRIINIWVLISNTGAPKSPTALYPWIYLPSTIHHWWTTGTNWCRKILQNVENLVVLVLNYVSLYPCTSSENYKTRVKFLVCFHTPDAPLIQSSVICDLLTAVSCERPQTHLSLLLIFTFTGSD